MSGVLVQVPGQPGIYVHRDFLSRLQKAEAHLGARLYLNPSTDNPLHIPLSGWRSHDSQEYLYEGYLHHLPGFNLAAAPGRSNHERGTAGDLVRIDAVAQAAMRWAGFVRDDREDWHWNLPNATSYPIIGTMPAGLDITPLIEGNDSMATRPVQYKNGTKDEYARRDGLHIETTQDKGLAGRWLIESGADGFVKANATKYPKDWAASILKEKAVLTTLITGAVGHVDVDEAAIGQYLLDHGIDLVTAADIAEIADAVVDEQHSRLAE